MLTRLMDISVTARMDTVECAVELVSTCSINSCRCLAGHGIGLSVLDIFVRTMTTFCAFILISPGYQYMFQ